MRYVVRNNFFLYNFFMFFFVVLLKGNLNLEELYATQTNDGREQLGEEIINSNKESFYISMILLVCLTLVVFILFINWFKKRRTIKRFRNFIFNILGF